MSFPRYPKYKDSGVEWLGEVPRPWTVTKLGRAVFMQEGPGLRTWQFADEGTRVICVTNITEAGIDFTRLEKFITTDEYKSIYQHFTVQRGDVLLSSSGNSWGKVAIYEGEEEVILNTSTIRLNESESAPLCRDFIAMLLQSDTVREQLGLAMTGSCQPNFGPTHLNSVMVVIPPRAEQTAIAAFLDRETAKIDGLVAEQRRLMELLKEKRQAVISAAVTRGIVNEEFGMRNEHLSTETHSTFTTHNSKCTPSGIEWLGDVPEHWVIQRVKFAAEMDSGHTPRRSTPEYWENCSIPWVLLNDTKTLKTNDYIEDTAIQISELGMANSSAHLIPAGSVVFTRDATIGLTAILSQPMAVSQHIITWTPNPKKLISEFLLPVFKAMEQYLISFTMGSTIKTIGMPEVRKLTFALPPLDEQNEIVGYLKELTNRLNTLAAEAQRAIDLLQERRTALISAAVTGQIDVRPPAERSGPPTKKETE